MTARDRRLAVVIPVFGNGHLTDALLGDIALEADRVDLYIVDNHGDYRSHGIERVLRPGRNLGWAGGGNLALEILRHLDYDAYVLLNNDVRLSRGFFGGLDAAWRETGAGLLGPVYDDAWAHQRREHLGSPSQWRPRAVHQRVPFLDGVCLFIPRVTLASVGALDASAFPRFNWGVDIDYAARVRHARLTVWTTEAAYLSHRRHATAAGGAGDWEREAWAEMTTGLEAKWGVPWREWFADGDPIGAAAADA